MYSSTTRLGQSFTLREFPCWEKATAADLAALTATVNNVLQPVRNRWGAVVPSSWKWWRSGCTPRTGAHAGGGTVDFVTPGADLRSVFNWGVANLMPLGYVGRWIYEPRTASQGEHIHMAPRADMVSQFGDAQAMAYVETGPGEYQSVGPQGPIDIPGITVTVAAFPPWMSWVLLGLLGAGLVKRSREG